MWQVGISKFAPVTGQKRTSFSGAGTGVVVIFLYTSRLFGGSTSGAHRRREEVPVRFSSGFCGTKWCNISPFAWQNNQKGGFRLTRHFVKTRKAGFFKNIHAKRTAWIFLLKGKHTYLCTQTQVFDSQTISLTLPNNIVWRVKQYCLTHQTLVFGTWMSRLFFDLTNTFFA